MDKIYLDNIFLANRSPRDTTTRGILGASDGTNTFELGTLKVLNLLVPGEPI